MPATVQFIRGPAGAGKTQRLLERFQSIPQEAGLWVGPTERAGGDAALRLGRNRSDPSFVTLARLARKIVRSADDGWRLISDAQQRLILADVIESARTRKELRYYAEAADRPGFVEAVLDWIVEIANRGVTPETFSYVVRQLPPRAKNDDIELLIERYNRRLREHRLLDRELVNERAAEHVRRGRLGPFRHVQCVLVDGFVDFTPSQSALLQELAERVQEVTIALPGEPARSNRQELFQRPERTLQQWHPRFRTDAVWTNCGAVESDKPAGLVALSERLFQSPAIVERAFQADGIHVISAPGELGEVRMVARHIKSAILNGVNPGSIVVTARSLSKIADRIDDVFYQYGIPWESDDKPPLARHPAVATALRAWRLAIEDFPFRETTALLRSALLQPAWDEANLVLNVALRSEVALRGLGVPRGRDEYCRALDRWAEKPEPALEDDEAQNPRRNRLHKLAIECRPFLQKFFRAWDGVQKRATWADHCSAFQSLCRDLGLICQPDDALALEALDAALADWGDLESRLCSSPPLHSAEEFASLIGRLAQSAVGGDSPERSDCVRVLAAETVRAVDCDHLYVLGLGERSFPDLSGGGPIYSEAERRELFEAGLPIRPSSERLPDEQLLFLQLVSRPRRSLTLSFSGADARGLPLLRSTFLESALRLFADGPVSLDSRTLLIEGFDSDPPLCPAEYRVQWALANEPARKNQSTGAFDHLRRIEQVARARFGCDHFTPFDGRLKEQAARAAVAAQFAPNRVISPSALESYVDCPFQFFLGRVLELEPLTEPGESVAPAPRGQAVHRALARMHRKRHDQGRHVPDDDLTTELVGEIDVAIEELASRTGHPATRELWRLEGRWLRRSAARYGQQWQAFLDNWQEKHRLAPRPHAFELDFGLPGDDGTRIAPMRIALDGDEMRVAGRIDRIDSVQLPDGTTGFWIIDYKTGSAASFTAKDVAALIKLQLPLYAMHVEQWLPQSRPLGFAYWFVSKDGMKVVLPGRTASWVDDAQSWQDRRNRTVRWVVDLVRAIRGAEFSLHPRSADCTKSCAFGQVCRIAQSRHVEKNWEGPVLPDTDA